MTKTGADGSTVNSQRKDILDNSTDRAGGAPAVVAVEVPWTYSVAQGVPPHRDID